MVQVRSLHFAIELLLRCILSSEHPQNSTKRMSNDTYLISTSALTPSRLSLSNDTCSAVVQ